MVKKKAKKVVRSATVTETIKGIPKRRIPHPSNVPDGKHDEVLELVKEQFFNGHYGVKPGTVEIDPIVDGEDRVTFIRTHDPKVKAKPHGIKGVK